MFAYYVNLNEFNSVKKFVAVAQSKLCTVALESNDGKWKVDGKSILGIFSLDLSRPVRLYVEDEDYAAFDQFRINSVV